jgi:hypothetical protein
VEVIDFEHYKSELFETSANPMLKAAIPVSKSAANAETHQGPVGFRQRWTAAAKAVGTTKIPKKGQGKPPSAFQRRKATMVVTATVIPPD